MGPSYLVAPRLLYKNFNAFVCIRGVRYISVASDAYTLKVHLPFGYHTGMADLECLVICYECMHVTHI